MKTKNSIETLARQRQVVVEVKRSALYSQSRYRAACMRDECQIGWRTSLGLSFLIWDAASTQRSRLIHPH